MKSSIWLAASALLLSAPHGLSKTELETLRSLCAEQERQIRQLEEENTQLRSLAGQTPRPSAGRTAAGVSNPSSRPAETAAADTYTIRAGDTLAKVARQHGTTVAALAKANGIKNPARISVGQKIRIPGGGASSPSTPPAPAPASPRQNAGGTHIVRNGETFYSIARQHGIDTQALIAANPGVKPSALKPGQQLRLTSSAVASAPPAPAKTGAPSAANPPSPTREVARQNPEPAPAASPSPKQPSIRSITVNGEMTYGEFASKYGTDVARLNDLNGLDLADATLLAKGSELYIPAQP